MVRDISLVLHHRATELIRKLDSRPAIGKAPAHVLVAIFVMSGAHASPEYHAEHENRI